MGESQEYVLKDGHDWSRVYSVDQSSHHEPRSAAILAAARLKCCAVLVVGRFGCVKPAAARMAALRGYPESSSKSLNTKGRNFHAKWSLEETGD
ncbi:MAG: hypothetical protein L0Z50_05070, partial [Verrucomicrobiales bacterium]|nr:hypothetical protein [Verrucomicrobiales bacterium]